VSSLHAGALARQGTAALGVGALAAAAGLAITVLGPVALVLAPLAVALYVMLTRPAAALAALLVVTVVLEEDEEGFLPVTSRFYEPLVAVASPTDLLLAVVVVAYVLDLGRRGESPRLPGAFTFPLLLLAGAVVAGVLTGYANDGDGYGIGLAVRTLAYVLILPLVVVHVLRTRASLAVFAFGALILGIYKGLEGTVAWVAGAGHPLGDATLTYFPPTANLVLLVLLLGIAAAVGERLKVPWWVWTAAPLAAVALVFSYRRSFWIAALLGLAVVVLLGRHRHRFLPILAVLGIAVWGSVALAGGNEAESLIVERASELDLSRVASNPSDRYRLGELRNVTREIRESPVTGIGLGVPWTVEYSFEYEPGARNYAHVAVLWFWLKLGLAGLVAYLWLMATALRVALRVSQTARDRFLRVAGTTLFATFVGIVLIEATATFTGANLRFTVVVAALVGWLAAAEALLREGRDEQAVRAGSG
jgi:hypothetical protein